jgi:hypothetical protein
MQLDTFVSASYAAAELPLSSALDGAMLADCGEHSTGLI